MRQKESDLAYSLGLLKKINALKIEGILLPNMFFYEKYNLWQLFQQQLFQDIKSFKETGNSDPTPKLFLTTIKDFFIGAFIFVISSIAFSSLVLLRKKMLVYCVDSTSSVYKSDFRLKEVYRFLTEHTVPYVELFHTILSRETIRNFFKRRRSALYMESLDWLASIFSAATIMGKENDSFVERFDYSSFSQEERVFVKNILIKYIQKIAQTRFKISFLRKVLKYTDLRVIFALDDVRFYHEIILAARLNGIPTYAFQHGHFTKYHIGWLWDSSFLGERVTPDYLLVWSSYWKQELLRLGSIFYPRQIVVGGIQEPLPTSVLNHHNKNEAMVVLIPYESACPQKEVASYIREMLKCPNTQVLFKVRPDVSIEHQLAGYGLSKTESAKFSIISDIKAHIVKVSLVAGVYSTFLYDMIAYNKPVAILDTSSDYGGEMIINGLADRLEKEGLCERLYTIASIKEDELARRKEKLFGGGAGIIADTLRKLALKHNLISP